MAINVKSGLENYSDEPRFHFDIYAILEGGQELFFGHETQVNVNIVETVTIALPDGNSDDNELEKCYLSPTKRRGVERRALIWAPTGNGLLGDSLNCGIPHTCSKAECPICGVFGGLITTAIEVEDESEKRSPTTLIGRLTHSGGVAIQELGPEEKQRAMHPSMLTKDPGKEPTPTPFKREYNQPGLLYPVYNHCLSMTEREFSAVAYAFMGALARLGRVIRRELRFMTLHLSKRMLMNRGLLLTSILLRLANGLSFRQLLQTLKRRKNSLKRLLFL